MPFIEKIRNLREERALNEQELHLLQEQFFEKKTTPAATIVAATEFPKLTGRPVPTTTTNTTTDVSTPVVGKEGAAGADSAQLTTGGTSAAEQSTSTPSSLPVTAAEPLLPAAERDIITMPLAITNFKAPRAHARGGAGKGGGAPPLPKKKLSLFAQRRELKAAGAEGMRNSNNRHMGRDYGATTASGPTIFSPDRRLTAHSPLAPFAGETTVSRQSHTKPTRSWAGSLEREIGLTAEQIHEQNERLLADMTEDEIREAQEEILGMLPPDVVKGLLQRNAPAPESSESAASLKSNHSDPMPRESNAQANANTDTNTNTETAEAETQFLRQLKERYFPNLPTEYEKLEWMGVCKPPVETTPTPMVAPASMPTLAQSDTTTDALPAESTCPPLRFDFRGMILPENTDLPVHKGLHHHGDRPDQAGYTLAELLYLARSAVAVQRVLPLRMLGQILGRCQQALLSDDTTPVPAPEPESVVDPKKSGKSRSVPIGRYPPDLATDILAYFHRARLPLYLMNSLYESHRTCIMTALDVLYGLLLPQGEPSLVPVPVQSIPPTTPFATPHHQFAEANLLAADRLAAQSTYTGLIQMGLVARLADLLGPRSPVVLPPMARYHALLLLWALVKVAGPRELAMDKDAVKALEKVLQSPSAPSQSESSGVVAETDEDTHPAQILDSKLKSLSTYLLTQIKPESDHNN